MNTNITWYIKGDITGDSTLDITGDITIDIKENMSSLEN